MIIYFPKKSFLRITKFISLVFLILFISAFAFSSYFRLNYNNKALPNIYFYDQKIGGMGIDDIKKTIVGREIETVDFIVLQYDGEEIKTKTSDLGFFWNKEETAESIIKIGRGKNLVDNFLTQLQVLFFKINVKMAYKFDEKTAEKYLEELAATIDKDPVDGKFEVVEGKVKAFGLSSDGQKLLVKKSLLDLKKSLVDENDKVELTINKIKAKNPSDLERMGIKELFATGESNFYGSPTNRIHNIKRGAEVFSGVLIAPGEIFSFIKTLGEVSANMGYLPELVIKEDKTIPEYGGGLCQVSTTFFRAALAAGFPIIERTPHAYRVSYYEPAGMDATIYDPYPDLKFKNDSKYYILVQTRIEGNNLYVDFYGTSDGREVVVYPPIIYNYVQPGEPIRIETEKLSPGEEKQIESAHVGADAYFTRKVTYLEGEVKEDRFDSHYIPWRTKIEVGKNFDPEPKID